MEGSNGLWTADDSASLGQPRRRPSASFRLRSESLNSVRLRRIFEAFDKNGDGFISTAELSQALQKLGLAITLPDLQSAVDPFVETGSGGLDFEGFSALHRSLGEQIFGGEAVPEGDEEDDMKEAFRVFDEDGDGFISAAELHGVIRRLGLPGGEDVESCEQMIFKVDENRDGRVDFAEFKQMIRAVTVRSS